MHSACTLHIRRTLSTAVPKSLIYRAFGSIVMSFGTGFSFGEPTVFSRASSSSIVAEIAAEQAEAEHLIHL